MQRRAGRKRRPDDLVFRQSREKRHATTLHDSSGQMSHVQVTTLAPLPLKRLLRLTGNVSFNGFKTTPVITPVGGPVSRILVVPGEHVRQGQTLLTLSSPNYSQMRAAYLK